LSPRVPDAAALDPIKITPVFTFPADDAEAADTAQQLQQTFDYGGSVTIPGRYIDRININASEEARRLVDAREEITQVELISEADNEGLPLPCTVDVETLTGEVVSSLTVQLQRRVSGRRGVTVSGSDASGVLTMTQLVDHPPAARAPGSVTFDIRSPVDHSPWAVRPVADFLLAWAPGNCISLRLGTATIGSAVISESLNVDRLQLLARVVVALDELQQRFGTQFPIPDGMTYEDLRELEMLRELFDEGRARWVDRGFTANIRADRIEGFLAIQPVEARAMRVEHEQLGFVYGNHHFDLGPVRLYAPKMLLMNRAEIEAAVGVGIDPQARWECVDGEHIYLERLTSTGEPDQAVAS